MGRVLKRVPLNFDWPLGEVWKGYLPPITEMKELFKKQEPWICNCTVQEYVCSGCEDAGNECDENASYCIMYNPVNVAKWRKEPPVGEGFQMWETTSDGSPMSPVFSTLDELCAWCTENTFTFANLRASKEEWESILTNGTLEHMGCAFKATSPLDV